MPIRVLPIRTLLSTHHVYRRPRHLALLFLTMAGLQVAAAFMLGALAGWDRLHRVLLHFQPLWLFGTAAALLVSFAGYYYAYRSVYRVDRGPRLREPQMAAVVLSSFAGFLAHGHEGLDGLAMRSAGAGDREVSVRASALAGLEQALLAVVGCVAAITVLVSGTPRPPSSFTLPWAVIPVPAMAVAFWLGERYRQRLRTRRGWRGQLGIFLDSIHLLRELHVRHVSAVLGMAVFWLAEGFAAWCGVAAAGVRMNFAGLLVGYATGLVFSRRTGPLGGAGVLAVVLPLAVSYSGVGLPTAAVGLLCYQVFSTWLPLPASLAGLPTLRRMGAQVPAPPGPPPAAKADAPPPAA